MYLHTFVNNLCTTCGEDLDYYADNMRDKVMIGPQLPVDAMQGTLPLTMTVLVPTW